jgi:hypothetical protein
MKETFLLKTSWQSVFEVLTDKQAGVLIKAVFGYIVDGEKPELKDPEVNMAFTFMSLDLDMFCDNYKKKVEQNRINARSGGAPKGNQNAKKATENNRMVEKTTEDKQNNRVVVKTTETTEWLKNNPNDNDNDNDNETDIEVFSNENTSCSEPSQSDAPSQHTSPSEKVVISFLLNDKTEYPIVESQVTQWGELYPAVDIMQELRNYKGWNLATPVNRKTSRGILKSVNRWLTNAQNSGRFYQHNKDSPAMTRAEKQVIECFGSGSSPPLSNTKKISLQEEDYNLDYNQNEDF